MIEVFRIDFMQQALVATLLVGITCGYVAVFVLLRRIVFVGVALAQISSAGVALATLLGMTAGLHPTLFSLGFVLVGVLFFSIPAVGRRIPQEGYIGVGYAAATALGILLVAHSAAGEARVLHLLFGDVLAARPADNLLMLGVFAAVGLVHALFHKEFVFVSFDPEMARTVGVRARAWDLLLYLTLGVSIAVAIRVAGALLVFAFLVIPGMVGLMLTQRLRAAFALSVATAIAAAVLGLYLSFVRDLPSAATIVFVAFALLCAAAPIARLRRA